MHDPYYEPTIMVHDSTKIQGVATLIGAVKPFVTAIKIKSRDQDVHFIYKSDQGMALRDDQACSLEE